MGPSFSLQKGIRGGAEEELDLEMVDNKSIFIIQSSRLSFLVGGRRYYVQEEPFRPRSLEKVQFINSLIPFLDSEDINQLEELFFFPPEEEKDGKFPSLKTLQDFFFSCPLQQLLICIPPGPGRGGNCGGILVVTVVVTREQMGDDCMWHEVHKFDDNSRQYGPLDTTVALQLNFFSNKSSESDG